MPTPNHPPEEPITRLNKKTLVVSCGLPPALNGSSNIITNLARQFSCTEMTLAGELSPGPVENQWKNNAATATAYYIHRQWPWKFKRTIRLLLFPVLLFRLIRICHQEKCEQVIGVFPNEFYLFLSLAVAKINRLPYYSYFHNTYLDNRSGLRLKFARWLQPKVFTQSRSIFVMSDGMCEEWKTAYPSYTFLPLVHTFNGPIPASPKQQPIGSDFRIAFMGNLNDSNRDAMSRVTAVLQNFTGCSLVTYSGVPDASFSALGLSGPRVTHTRAAYDKVVAELQKFDLLFLPHGFTGGLKEIEYRTIFPTRTIPYLLSGVPIIAHTPPNAFLTDWLQRFDCASIVDSPSETELVKAFEILINNPARREELAANARISAQQFRASYVANELRQILNQNQPAAGKLAPA